MVLPENEEIGLIQGREPGSKAEWYVSQVLENLEIRYMYQFDIFGGNNVAGGVIVDFVIFNPWAIPAEVMGEYWHRGLKDPKERFRIELMRQYFNRDPLIWWDYELEDYQTAFKTVNRDLKL